MSLSPLSVAPSDLDGHIQVIFGPMFSGKTTELMRRIRRYTHAKKSCLMIKYKRDTRYDDECASTHDRQMCPARGANMLSEISNAELACVDVIGVDEGQFFNDEIVAFADLWASRGKVVIVAALDATFERKRFGAILDLVPLAESVVKLLAVCMLCHKEAAFTKRIGSEMALEVIGGSDKYLSTCRQCFSAPADSPMPASPIVTPVLAAAEASPSSAPASPTSTHLLSPLMMSASHDLALPLPSAEHAEPASSGSFGKRISAPLQTIDTNAGVDATAAGHKRKVSSQVDQLTTKRQHLDKENVPQQQTIC